MKKSILKGTLLLVLIAFSVSYSQYVVKGKLTGADGASMKRADIVWVSNGSWSPRDIVKKFTVNDNGSFEFDTHRKGMHRIWFCGVGHKSFLIPLYLDKPDTTILNVQLQPVFSESIKLVTLLIGYNYKTRKYDLIDTLKLNGREAIKRVYKSTGPEFRYEVKETGANNYFNGTMADYYSFDCDSTFENLYNYCYTNVIKSTKDSLINFEFDPSKFSNNSVKENYTFEKADKKTTTFLSVHEAYEKAYNKYRLFAQDVYKKYGQDHDSVNKYSFDDDMKEFDEKIKNSKDEFERNCWIVVRLGVAGVDAFGKKEFKISKELAKMAINSIEPSSPLWSHFAGIMGVSLAKAASIDKKIEKLPKSEIKFEGMDNPYINYAISALNNHPDPTIRDNLYRTVIGSASRYGRIELVTSYFEKYKAESPRERDLKPLLDSFSPNRIIKEGKKIPPFKFASVSDSTKIITNTDMMGKKYLIHIWADWCGPCRTEVEAIRNLNNRFAGKNFAVLSVSICFTKENLLKFQKDHQMPWFNTHVDMNNDTAGFMKSFEVSAIPKQILVDEKGTIIEVNSLDKILESLSKK